MASLATVLVLVLSTVLVQHVAECQINRQCKEDTDCAFVNQETRTSRLMLKCASGSCQCDRAPDPHGMEFSLKFSGAECFAGRYAPCGGDDHGITIACDEGLKCMMNRCRDPFKDEGTVEEPLNGPCVDTNECQEGLSCSIIEAGTKGPRFCKPPSFSP